jgi:hypothetical protein
VVSLPGRLSEVLHLPEGLESSLQDPLSKDHSSDGNEHMPIVRDINMATLTLEASRCAFHCVP